MTKPGQSTRLGVGLSGPSGGGDEVSERLLGLLPSSGLETTVWVDDEQVGGEDLGHGGNSVLDLLLSWNSGRVDVVNTWADLVRVAVRLEDVEQLEVGLGSLDRDDVGVQSLDRGEDVSKVRVAEVRVDLDVVLDTRRRESERVDGPGQVVVPVSLSEGQTLSDSWLIDLDGLDAALGEVDDLVSESESELLGLDLLGDVGSGERPVEDGDWASQHTLHGLARERLGVRGPSDSHWGWSRDVGDDDGGSDVSGSVRLNPTKLGEDESGELFTKVLNHVVSLGFTVHEQVEADLLLEVDGVLDLRLHGLFVLLLSELTLAELGSGQSDLLGLGERTDGGGWELGQVEVLLLGLSSLGEWRLSLELLLGDGGNSVSDGRVRGSLELSSGGNVLGVLLEQGRLLAREGTSKGGNLLALLLGKGQPRDLLRGELLLDLDRDWGVEQGRRGRDDDSLLTEGRDGLLGQSLGGLEVGLPDVSAGDDTKLEVDLGVLDGGKDGVELLWLSVQVEVESGNREVLEELDRFTNSSVGGGEGDLGGDWGKGLVDLLVLGTPSLGSVGNEDWLVNLDVLDASLLELLEELGVDWDQLVEEREWLKVLVLSGLGDEGEVGDGTEENGSGGDTKSLGLFVLLELLVSVELELGGWGVRDFDNVVVGVEAEAASAASSKVYQKFDSQLAHLAGDDIDTLGLVLSASAHGEVGVQGGEVLLGISLWDDTEVVRVVEELVVEGEFTTAKSISSRSSRGM